MGPREVETLRIPRSLYERLLAEARQALPNECCGLLGGQAGHVAEVFPATNALASASAFEIAPRELFAIFRRLREQNLVLAGIYHSHPTGQNVPSARDCERAYYPDAAYVIVSPQESTARPLRAFRLRGAVEELDVEITG